MAEHSDWALGSCPEATANGHLVSISVDHNQPLLQRQRALPWNRLFEVITRHWRRAGQNTDGRPGFPGMDKMGLSSLKKL